MAQQTDAAEGAQTTTADEFEELTTEALISKYKIRRAACADPDVSDDYRMRNCEEATNIEEVLAERGITNEELHALYEASDWSDD